MNIADFLAGIPVNAVLRERIARLLEENEQLKRKIEVLENEKSQLVAENTKLHREAAHHETAPDSTIFRGVVFKGISKGIDGIEIECAKCRIALSEPPPRSSSGLFCSKCGFIASFNWNGLPDVLAQLPKQ